MERLYQIISRHFSQTEIANLASDLGVYVPSNAEPTAMARELFSASRRNVRLDVLFNEVYRRKPGVGINLRPNLYELIAGTFNEKQAAQLARKLGLDRLNVGLDAGSLIGWNNDDFFKNRKARTLQETAEKEGKYGDLLAEMLKIRPSLDLTAFQQYVEDEPPAAEEDEDGEPDRKGRPSGAIPAKEGSVVQQYFIDGDFYGGDRVEREKFGGDKVEGDKAGGNVVKDVDISGASGSSTSFGGDAIVGNQVRDVQGDMSVENQSGGYNLDALLLLLDHISEKLNEAKSEMRERDAREAAEDLEAVQEELAAEEPDGDWIIRKLEDVARIAGAAGAAASAAGRLGPHLDQAIQITRSLFGG